MPRWISWSPAAGEAKSKCVARDARLADAFDALVFLIVRDPAQGTRFSEAYGGLYLIVSSDAGTADTPVARMVYRYGEHKVVVLMASC